MKLQSDKEGFIKGLSFDKISVEIDVSKPTLLKWDQIQTPIRLWLYFF